jgi:hypothetical protein
MFADAFVEFVAGIVEGNIFDAFDDPMEAMIHAI